MNKYSQLTGDALTEHMSNFIIERVSYSSVRTFQRNELAYSMRYIYKIYSPSGVAPIAGSAYHKAVEEYFKCLKDKNPLPDLAMLSDIGFNYIDFLPEKDIKTGKTHKTVEEVKAAASENFKDLILNFLAESDAYLDDIAEVLFVEQRFEGFITLAGWDCPLPFVCVIDLVYRNKEGKICMIDHKSKTAYTDPETALLKVSSQAVINSKLFEMVCNTNPEFEKFKGEKVFNFNYLENKISKNRDRSRQIHALPMPLDDETLAITELLVAEATRRVIEASQNPDYEYLPNPDDNFDDAKDLFDFWVKTKTQNYEDFTELNPIQKKFLSQKKRQTQIVGYSKIRKIDVDRYEDRAKQFVSLNFNNMEITSEKKIENTLRMLGKPARVAEIIEGYAADTYLLEPGGGVAAKSIMNAKVDIAGAIGVENVLILDRLVVREGRSYIGVDVPRLKKDRRYAKADVEKLEDKIPLGISNLGEKVYWYFAEPSSPHLLISGSTGSGKSVLLKNLMEACDELGYEKVVIDPKMEFDGISDQEEIEAEIESLVRKMNSLYKKRSKTKLMIFIDEVSDLFANETRYSKDEETKTLSQNILILAQKARAAGIHIVMASQRFSTKIMSGDIKANFAARVALTCASSVDSQVMIETDSAAELCGNGDAIVTSPQLRNPVRIQCFS